MKDKNLPDDNNSQTLDELTRDINQIIDQETAAIVVEEMGHKPKLQNENAIEEKIILDLNLEDTQKKLDKALKRNLDNQSPKPIKKEEASTGEDLVEAVK